MGTPAPASISELSIPDLRHASPTGYARSKLVAERVVRAAVEKAGARATVLRIGQIIPPREKGNRLWNTNEMIPMLVKSALTTGVLPERVSGSDACSWLPDDVLAESILNLAGLSGREMPPEKMVLRLMYNLVHPKPSSWANDFLPALKAAGLDFKMVKREEWIRKLVESKESAEQNPSLKLLGYWKERGEEQGEGAVSFETKAAEEGSGSLREAEKALDERYVKDLLKAWREAWAQRGLATQVRFQNGGLTLGQNSIAR